MIEKKTVWAVTRDLRIEVRTAIVDDGKVLAAKATDKKDTSYNGCEFGVMRYFDTEEEAKKWAKEQEQEIREMVPKVKSFIERLDWMWDVREHLGINKEDYLGNYAIDSSDNARGWYDDECKYARKLETFIRSRMLDIGSRLIPIGDVKQVKWCGYENADECEAADWKASITTKDDEEYETESEEDVRLIWATIGKVSGNWFVDNDFDYNKKESDD